MTAGVTTAVLIAASIHALWNSLIKASGDRLAAALGVAIAGGLWAVPLAAASPLPGAAALPYLAGSALLHVAYFTLVGVAYRKADLSVAYPLARGTAPLLSAAGAALVIGEIPSPLALSGLVVLCCGIVLLGLGARHAGRPSFADVLPALVNAVVIAAYTVTDGIGSRLAGSATSYLAWLYLLTGLATAGVSLPWRRALLGACRRRHRALLAGGLLSLAAYGICLWAMTRAPIALVAALRETSVLFGALLAMTWLGEGRRPERVVAAAVVAGGIALLRLG